MTTLDRHLERFRAEPGDDRAFEALEEHYFVTGAWQHLTALYEHRLTAPAVESEPQVRTELLYRLGQVWAERRGDEARAISCHRRVLEVDRGYRPALRALRRLHSQRSQWDVALQIAEVEAGLPVPPAERATLLAEMGQLWLDRLDDAETALDHFESACADPAIAPAEAFQGAARCLERLGRAEEAVEAWEHALERLRGPACVPPLLALGRLLVGPLADPDRAAEALRRALTHDPRSAEATEALARLATDSGQWSLLADLQERRFELCEDEASRARIALEAGRVHLEHIHDPAAALGWFKRAVVLAPRDLNAQRGLADVARETGDQAALLGALERMADLGGDHPPLSLLIESASIHAGRGDHERACEALRRAQERVPDDATINHALSESLARLGRHEERVPLLEQQAALPDSDDTTRAGVLTELGRLHEELGDPGAARETLERAFSLDATAPDVAVGLERLYREAEAWDSLRGLLEAAGRDGPVQQRAHFLCALGELIAEHFDDTSCAALAFEAVLALDSSSVRAHRGLQQLALDQGDEAAILRAYEDEAAITTDPERMSVLVRQLAHAFEAGGSDDAALEWVERWVSADPDNVEALCESARIHEKLGHDADLVALLLKLDPLLQPSDQARNRSRLGDLHASRGRREEAIHAYETALEARPDDTLALEALVEQLEIAGRPEELAPALRWLADLSPPARRAECLDRLAALLADRLGDTGSAIEVLARLEAEGTAAPEASARLDELLDRSGRQEELVERLLTRQRALDPEQPELIELMLRRARLLAGPLGRFEDATTVYREVRILEPDSVEARDGYEKCLRAAQDVTGLAEFLAEEAESSSDPNARDRCVFERALLLEEVLDDRGEATEAYQQLAQGANDPALRAQASEHLETLLQRSADWTGLRAHLEAALPGLGSAEDAEIHERLGVLCRDRLADTEGAASHLEVAAQLAPERSETWQALAELYAENGHSSDQVSALESELALGPDHDRELTLRCLAAEICEGSLADEERALAHYERIVELDPSHSGAAEFVIERWERDGRIESIVELLEKRLTLLDQAPRDEAGHWAASRASLRLRIAGLRATRLDDPDGAIAVLEPVLGELGPKAVVAEPLADLYQRAGYTEDLVELCQRAAEACEDSGERANWLIRQGDALRRRHQDTDAAAAYRRALSDRPDDRSAQAALSEIYRRLGDSEPLARLLEAELTRQTGPAELPIRMELARLLSGPLDRNGAALLQLRRVLQIDPAHAEAFERAVDLAEGAGQTDIVIELLEGALARKPAPSARADLLARRGRLLARTSERAAEAVGDLRQALVLDPTRTDAREALRGVLETTGDWQGVLECIWREAADAVGDGERRALLFERAAALAAEHLGSEASLPWLERLRRERPRDPTVARRIAEVHRVSDRPQSCLRALGDELALVAQPQRRREIHMERAELLREELGWSARAVAELEEARQLFPADLEILRRLDALLRGLGRDAERVAILEALLEIAPEEERVALHCEAASLHGDSLKDPRKAAFHLLHAVALTPARSAVRAELLRSLGEALHQAGPRDAWARCAEAELEALDPHTPVFAERRRALHRDLARNYEHRLARADAAVRHLNALLDAGAQVEDAVEDDLLRLLRGRDSWVELEGRLAARLERRPEDTDAWLELARLRAEKLRSSRAALNAYRRVIDLDPRCLPALRGLRAEAEKLGEWSEVAETLDRELEHPEIVASSQRSALLRKLGDTCWHRLQATTRASRSYAAAIEANPGDLASLRALQRLLEAMEDWRGALDLYESEVGTLGDRQPQRRVEALLRVGELARDRTDEPDRALRAYVAASELAALPAERRAELAELHHICGEQEAFARVFAGWCDDPAVRPASSDLLRLAHTLEGFGRGEEALARAERALELDPEAYSAWDLTARLHESRGDAEAAADSLVRAAELTKDGAARLQHAAELIESADPARAVSLLREAVAADTGAVAAQALLARTAERVGADAEAEAAATQALELAAAAGEPGAGSLREVALAGARAAGRLERRDAAARFYGFVLETEPDHPAALAGSGEALAALGDLAGARRALEQRVALGPRYPERASHRALLAHCLRTVGDVDGALAHCEAALRDDPGLDEAHALCADLLENADRIDAGVAALERWADATREPSERARRLLRAADWELRSGGRSEAAERHLRDVLDADPVEARAWQALATLLWDGDRIDEALEVATRALEGIAEGEARGPLALVRGRALERRNDRNGAAEAYADAATADRRAVEAAISAARLLRADGDWRGATGLLRRFADRHPGDDAPGLARVLEQLGRLLAGPLEDVTGAVTAYRRAVELNPECPETRGALATLLSHRPDDWREAVEHHRVLLEAEPTHAPSLRSLLRVAQSRGTPEAGTLGLAVVRALGLGGPTDADADAAPNLRLAIAGDRELDDPIFEKLRLVASKAASEIAQALEATGVPGTVSSGDGFAAFRNQTLLAQARLTAPALLPLSPRELSEVLVLVAALTLEPEQVHGDGRRVNRITAALGRRARRRLRRILDDTPLEAVTAVDFDAWRSEVRALAAAVVVEEGGADLRTALAALASDALERPAEEIAAGTDLTALVAASPEATILLRRVVRAWLRAF